MHARVRAPRSHQLPRRGARRVLDRLVQGAKRARPGAEAIGQGDPRGGRIDAGRHPALLGREGRECAIRFLQEQHRRARRARGRTFGNRDRPGRGLHGGGRQDERQSHDGQRRRDHELGGIHPLPPAEAATGLLADAHG